MRPTLVGPLAPAPYYPCRSCVCHTQHSDSLALPDFEAHGCRPWVVAFTPPNRQSLSKREWGLGLVRFESQATCIFLFFLLFDYDCCRILPQPILVAQSTGYPEVNLSLSLFVYLWIRSHGRAFDVSLCLRHGGVLSKTELSQSVVHCVANAN